MTQQFLNDPPSPEALGETPNSVSPDEAADLIRRATATPEPMIEAAPDGVVKLPAGLLRDDGFLVTTAQVRELNGYDEEKLSRIDFAKNPAVWMTELLSLGVEKIGGEKPTPAVLRQLLIGDRDALMLGIREATFGPTVELRMTCQSCGHQSDVFIGLDEIPVVEMEDPQTRVFTVELRHGNASVRLLNGAAQEALSDNLGNRTQAEINTIVLANSLVEINGEMLASPEKEQASLALSAADRQTLIDFVNAHQPGPQLGKAIDVNCATCNQIYPVVLGISHLFRF